MAVNKGTLGKQTVNGIEYIYPKTSADIVEYTDTQSVKEKLDSMVDLIGASSTTNGTHGFVPAPPAGKQLHFLRGDATWVIPTDTTYTAGAGMTLSGTTFINSGVRSIATGTSNGTISVNTNGTTANVSVKGLGDLAYKSSLTPEEVGALPADATAVSATKLATGRAIDGVTFNGTAAITHYGICSTAAGTTDKVVSCTNFTLTTGARIIVKFTVTNTAANPTLNVNSTGAKAIQYRGSAITAGYLAANRTYEFVYDGTNYQLVGDIDTNTNTWTKVTTSADGYINKLSGSTTNFLRGDGNWADIPEASTSAAGLMTSAMVTKLNGISSGANAITVDSALSSTSTNPVQNKAINTALGNKVDKVSGKGLSTNDYTTDEKTKLSGIATGAQVNVIESVKVNGTALTISSKAVNVTVPSYSAMTGATSSAAGTSGLVPAPAAGKQTSFLRGDGTWVVPTNTTYSLTSTDDGNGNVTLTLTAN